MALWTTHPADPYDKQDLCCLHTTNYSLQPQRLSDEHPSGIRSASSFHGADILNAIALSLLIT